MQNGSRVSTAHAYTAHREWASRPPDERYASVHQLYEAACARRSRTIERITDTVRVRADDPDTLVLDGPVVDGDRSALTHWSFEQLAGIAGAPPNYLRTLPAPIAAAAINVGLDLERCRTRRASALRGGYRPVDPARDHLPEVRARPPRRAGQTRAPSHGRTSVLAVAARLQGRCLWR
jgi:hypothetical protein